MQLCSKLRGASGIEPKTFRRRGQLLSRPPTTGHLWWLACSCGFICGARDVKCYLWNSSSQERHRSTGREDIHVPPPRAKHHAFNRSALRQSDFYWFMQQSRTPASVDAGGAWEVLARRRRSTLRCTIRKVKLR